MADTMYVADLRNAIVGGFPKTLENCAPNKLRVWTPNATFELSDLAHPLVWTPSTAGGTELTNATARLADVLRHDQPGPDGMLQVYVPLPKTEAARAGKVFIRNLRLLNEAKQLMPATTELKRGDMVWVDGAPNNLRDEANQISKHPLLISEVFLAFLNKFWSEYKKQTQEFNFRGPSGAGKSCAAKILAAEISRKMPEITLFYERSPVQFDSQLAGQLKDAKRPTVAIFDQIRDEQTAADLGALADEPGLTVILISVNLVYFRTDSQGRQHNKLKYEFPFGNCGEECARAMGMPPVTFTPREPSFDWLEISPPETFLEQCQWTNGHLQSLACLIMQKQSPAALVAETAALMSQYFCDGTHAPFYLAMVKMFKTAKKSVVLFLGATPPDLRYVDSGGKILSPLFLKAYEMFLLNLPPPPSIFTAPQQLTVEACFALERECLQDAAISKAVFACLSKLDNTIQFPRRVPCSRICFRTFSQIADEITRFIEGGHGESELEFPALPSISEVKEPPAASWIVHGIPVIWNESNVEGLHVYCLKGRLFIIGFSVTVQTAQQHTKSLKWLDELAELGGKKGANVQFILLFVSKQLDDSVKLACPIRIPKRVCSVMDYPIQELLSQPALAYSHLDDERVKQYGPRVLDIVRDNKRKLPEER